MKKIKKNFKTAAQLIAALLFLFLPVSCKKYLDVGTPKDKLVTAAVFKDNQTATAAIVGIYSDMMQTFKLLSSNINWFTGLSTDEMAFPVGSSPLSFVQMQANQVTPDNADINTCWSNGYSYIYDANDCIEGLNASTGLSDATKNQLLGEAKFIRAFTYFYMVNLWGDVPLVTTTEQSVNAALPRTDQNKIYDLITQDLLDAQSLLPAAYTTPNRVRPNKWTATALLARVYLYRKDWKNAELQASQIISSGTYSMNALASNFLNTSNETIWQLMPVNPSYNTLIAFRGYPTNATVVPNLTLTNDLVNSFESGDQRRTTWVGSQTVNGTTYYFSGKYKLRTGTPLNEYYIVFRLAEQYLIRAEARAQQSNPNGAVDDINIVRNRAGLAALPYTLTLAQLLPAIEKERRVELFEEWGDRWFNLKRTGRIDAVMSAYRNTWKSTASLWPIPLIQLNANPNLTQNNGY